MKRIKYIFIIIVLFFLYNNTYAVTVPFKDVNVGDWFYDSVEKAYHTKTIMGYSKETFAPGDKVTRGQIVTILWRIEGCPNSSTFSNRFIDVGDAYYTDAIKWASSNDIIHGYNALKFGPNDPIIRQDLAVILNNYFNYKHLVSSDTANLSSFADYNRVKDGYAEPALKWAVSNRIMSGQNLNGIRYLSPYNNATRAETAAMIVNFITSFNIDVNYEVPKDDLELSDIYGKWYVVGSNDETIEFVINDILGFDSFMFLTEHINPNTFVIDRENAGGGFGTPNDSDDTWKRALSLFDIKLISNNEIIVTKNSNTLHFSRIASIILTNSIELPDGDLVIEKGIEHYPFGIIVYPENADNIELSLESSNNDVVSVILYSNVPQCNLYSCGYSGYLIPKNYGEATITVTAVDSGISNSFKVTVPKVDVESITLDKNDLDIYIGETTQLNANIHPDTASIKDVTWKSSNTNVVSVDNNGNITAISKGVATITATSVDGGFSASCIVNVDYPPLTGTATIGYTTKVTSNSIISGISVHIYPSGGTGIYSNYHITLVELNNNIVIGEANTNDNIFVGYKNGTYKVYFEFTDSNGTEYSGCSNVVTINMA